MEKLKTRVAGARKGLGATAAWRRNAVLLSCVSVVACDNRALVGSFACDDSDSGGGSNDAGYELASCSPASCTILGTWQIGGYECKNDGGLCTPVIPPCAPGAIRFEASGALSRLTSVGWESACGFATCGGPVIGLQVSNLLAANYAAARDPFQSCEPWYLSIEGAPLDGGGSSLGMCTLRACALCAGVMSIPAAAVCSVEVAYSRCEP
jgi:hypothetical protein